MAAVVGQLDTGDQVVFPMGGLDKRPGAVPAAVVHKGHAASAGDKALFHHAVHFIGQTADGFREDLLLVVAGDDKV